VPTYILGRDQSITAPGVNNDDVKKVTLKVSGSEQDVTVFKSTALTQIETMIGLVDISFEVTATAATAQVGDSGTFVIGHLDGSTLSIHAVVTDRKMSVTPKGVQEVTISYAIQAAPASP
jgi:hypothetical protein